MPATFRIDEEQRVVYSRAWDTVTDEDILVNRAALFADPAFAPDLDQLYDFTAVTTVAVTPEALRQMASTSRWAPTARRAIVVSGDLAYGMARMFGLLSAREDDGYQIFRDVPTAEKWLRAARQSGRPG